jgi:hypothetical protein
MNPDPAGRTVHGAIILDLECSGSTEPSIIHNADSEPPETDFGRVCVETVT